MSPQFFETDIASATDYYPFGMEMPGRVYHAENYRFGFNGKENDRSWGTSLIQDYGFRLYNPSICRFFTVDPLTQKYPWYTPYQFAGNKPIKYVDLDGLEEGNKFEYAIAWMHAIHLPPDKQLDYVRASIGNFDIPITRDQVHTILFLASFIPEYGPIFAAVNTALYAAEGNYTEAGCAAAGGVAGVALPKLINALSKTPIVKKGVELITSKLSQSSKTIQKGIEVLKSKVIPAGGKAAGEEIGSGAGKVFNSGVEDVITNPSLLEGKSLAEVQKVLKDTPGWKEGALEHGRSKGEGWTLHQLNMKGTGYTDKFIQYSPGSSRHFGGAAYWKVCSGNGGKQWFKAGK